MTDTRIRLFVDLPNSDRAEQDLERIRRGMVAVEQASERVERSVDATSASLSRVAREGTQTAQSLGRTSDELERMASRTRAADRVIEDVEQSLDGLGDEAQDAARDLGRVGEAADSQGLREARRVYQQLQQQIDGLGDELGDLRGTLDQVDNALNDNTAALSASERATRDLAAELRELDGRFQRAGDEADDFADELERADDRTDRLDRRTRGLNVRLGGLRTIAGLAAGALAAIGGAALAGEILEGARNYEELNNKLRLVTETELELTRVREKSFSLAQRTFQEFEGTVDLFSRISRATQDLNLGEDRIIGIVETINQAVTLSGGTREGQRAAIQQLLQGLSADTFGGDELRSVREQAPELARAIADGLGVAVGELRELGAAGELTAERVVGALEKSASAVDELFGNITLSLTRAQTLFRNQALVIGQLAGEEGVQALTEGLVELRENLATPEAEEAARVFGEVLGGAIEGVLDLLEALTSQNALEAFSSSLATTADVLSGLKATAAETTGVIVDLITGLEALVGLEGSGRIFSFEINEGSLADRVRRLGQLRQAEKALEEQEEQLAAAIERTNRIAAQRDAELFAEAANDGTRQATTLFGVLNDTMGETLALGQRLNSERIGADFVDDTGLAEQVETLREYNRLLRESGEGVADEYLAGVERERDIRDDLNRLLEEAGRLGIELTDTQQDQLESLLRQKATQEGITEELRQQREEAERIGQATARDAVRSIFGQTRDDLRGAGFGEAQAIGAAGQAAFRQLLQDFQSRAGVFEDLPENISEEAERAILEALTEGGADHAELLRDVLEDHVERLSNALKTITDSLIEDLIFEGGRNLGDILKRGAREIFSREIIGPITDGIFSGQGIGEALSGAFGDFSDKLSGVLQNAGIGEGLAGRIAGASPYVAAAIASVDLSQRVGRNIDSDGISADTERFTQFGGIVGGLLGGLFSKASDRFARGVFDANSGGNVFESNKTGENLEGRNAFEDALGQITGEIARLTGGSFSEQLGFSFGSRDGIQILRNAGLNGGGDSAFRSGNVALRTEDPEEALRFALEFLVDSLEGGDARLTSFAQSVVDSNRSIEQILASLDVFAQAIGTGNDAVVSYAEAALDAGRSAETVARNVNALGEALAFTVEPVSQVRQAIDAINEAFDPVISDMQALGQATDALAQSQRDALQALGADFIGRIEDDIARIQNATLFSFEQLLEAQKQDLDDARALLEQGGITEGQFDTVRQRNALQQTDFFRNLSQDELNDLGDYLGLIREQGGGAAVALFELNRELDPLLETLQTGLSDLRAEADAFLAAARANRGLSDDISRRLSGETQGAQLLTLRSELQSLLTTVQGGGEDALAAAEQAPEIAQQFISLAEQRFGASGGLADARDFVTGILDQIAAEAEGLGNERLSQIEAAEQQIAILEDIRAALEGEDPALDVLTRISEDGNILNRQIADLLDTTIEALANERAATNFTAAQVQGAAIAQFPSNIAITNTVQTTAPDVAREIAQSRDTQTTLAQEQEDRDAVRDRRISELTDEIVKLRQGFASGAFKIAAA